MIRNPIGKVLSTLRTHDVRFLLMGGQACVFYGAAEFSRDTDIVLLAEQQNLTHLSAALAELQAECIAVPPFAAEHLVRGHAVHFRCRHPEADGIWIDIMSVLRGVEPFERLWARRTTIETESGEVHDLISLPDLVKAKKTQRDKDWPMIRRLVEANYHEHRDSPAREQVDFWLRECRTPGLLIEIAGQYPGQLAVIAKERPLLERARAGEHEAVLNALEKEEKSEREADRAYWAPLVAELEQMRHARSRGKSD
ncbi:MAG: hypothetical protein JXR37_29785 [Kiritimatiellae bacterium]|nr:hypothetical protein [Kiritimatiellia bacterium]